MDYIDWFHHNGFIYHFDQSNDIAELFLVSDMLITDYSSVMFDYSILHRPMFFYAYDLDKYKNDLRGFYFDYRGEMPGPISTNTEELIHDIRNYDASEYDERYENFRKNNPEDILLLKRRLGLPLDKKILLYAPTFRDDEFNENSSYKFSPKLSF